MRQPELAHAFLRWPAIRGELVSSQVPADLGKAIGIGRLYGSGAMLTFGVMVLMVGWPGRAGHVGVVKVAGPILPVLRIGMGALRRGEVGLR